MKNIIVVVGICGVTLIFGGINNLNKVSGIIFVTFGVFVLISIISGLNKWKKK